MKHVPIRSCIVCRQQKDKSQLVRIVRGSDGSVALDTSGKAEGRGAYVCKSAECVSALAKRRALDRTFKQNISSEVYTELEQDFARLFGNEHNVR